MTDTVERLGLNAVVELLNEDTGEIEQVALRDLPAIKRLTYAGAAIHNTQKKIAVAKEAYKAELHLVKSRYEGSIEALEIAELDLLGIAQAALQGDGMDGILPKDTKKRPVFELPGVGKFKWQKLRAKLDMSLWDVMPNEYRENLHAEFPSLIVEQVVYKPATADIKIILKKQGPTAIRGFKLIEPEGDKLSFG